MTPPHNDVSQFYLRSDIQVAGKMQVQILAMTSDLFHLDFLLKEEISFLTEISFSKNCSHLPEFTDEIRYDAEGPSISIHHARIVSNYSGPLYFK